MESYIFKKRSLTIGTHLSIFDFYHNYYKQIKAYNSQKKIVSKPVLKCSESNDSRLP